MIKQYKKQLLLTSIVTLLPILAGLLLWDQLPEQLPIHWNINGEVDSWGSKPAVVLGMPVLLMALNWICAFVSAPYKRYTFAVRTVGRSPQEMICIHCAALSALWSY